MGDSWEDWDAEDYTPPPPGGAAAQPAAVDSSKARFEDEDVEEDAPKWEGNVPKPQKVRGSRG